MTPQAARQPAPKPAEPPPLRNPTPFWDLLDKAKEQEAKHQAGAVPLPEIDDNKVALAGIRKIAGERLTLYTDLPPSPTVDELPKVFDLAYPQWREYFRVKADRRPDWRMRGFLMKDRQKFQATGLLPDDLPPFNNGYARYHELWFNEQPSDYYRRHLMLHEGTHAFMYSMLGGMGKAWYAEGMAELLGTHHWQNGKLTLRYFPRTREETPYLGRIKLVRDAFAERRAMLFENVLAFDSSSHNRNDAYAWSWAAAAFLDGHPRYQDRFRQLFGHVANLDEFHQKFLELYAEDWSELTEEWQFFVSSVDYGYNLARAAVVFKSGEMLTGGGAAVSVEADRAWQSSGLRLEQGQTYQLTAHGRYQVANQPRIWWCEPNGVTIRYEDGLPLGVLLAAVRPDKDQRGPISAFLAPLAVGLSGVIKPQQSGTLYLRINESPAGLDDNAGSLEVRVTREE